MSKKYIFINMRIVTTIGLFVFIRYMRRDLISVSERLAITDVKSIYLSNNYINVNTCQVKLIKMTENHNRLDVNCEVLQNLPEDIKIDVRVFRSSDVNGPWESVANYASYICDQNESYHKYHKYWSNLLMKQTEEGKCIQKGKYAMKDAGVFKFWELLPKNETKGYYFMSRNALKTSEIIIAVYEYYYKSIEV